MIGYHFMQIVIVWSMYSNSVYYLYLFIYSLHLPLQLKDSYNPGQTGMRIDEISTSCSLLTVNSLINLESFSNLGNSYHVLSNSCTGLTGHA